MSREKDIRKSNFVATTAFQSGDYLDLVRSGQNMRIVYSDFIAALGVLGSLQSLGETAAIPIYLTIGPDNYIRKILGGSGILASVSSQNGIKLDHNFTVDKGGVPIMVNEAAASPVLRSLVAGTGITIGGSGNEVQISTSGTPGSTKTIQVFTIDDFPTPSAGIITLADNTEYLVLNDITTANRFIMGDACIVKGSDSITITLEYTGTGTMFTSTDKDIKFQDINLVADSGILFNISSTTGTHIFRLIHSSFSCDELGSFTGLGIAYFFSIIGTMISGGVTFSGAFGTGFFSTMYLAQASGTNDCIDLGTATFDSFDITHVLFNINTTGYVLTGAANSANINANGLGTLINSIQSGSASFLNGNITSYDDRWEMHLNPGIVNSFDLVLATHAGATITISTINTPVIIGATWVTNDAHRFTGVAGGIWTYNGKGTHVEVTATISGAAASVSDTYTFYLALNGTPISASGVSRVFTTSIGNLSLIWDIELTTNDTLSIWVENNTGTRDFIVDQITMRARS